MKAICEAAILGRTRTEDLCRDCKHRKIHSHLGSPCERPCLVYGYRCIGETDLRFHAWRFKYSRKGDRQ